MREDTVIVERETDFCCYNPTLLSGVDHHGRGPFYLWVALGLAPPKITNFTQCKDKFTFNCKPSKYDS